VGEPALRVKLRRPFGKVSVPVLTTDDGEVLSDSFDIARWADGRGDGPRLFPSEHEAKIRRFVELSERGLAAGRALSLERILEDDAALSEMVPGAVRRALGSIAPRLGAFGVRRTLRKYGGHRAESEQHRRTFLGVLDEIRAALGTERAVASGAVATLLGRFSFADVAVAQVIVFVAPPPSGLKLGRNVARVFSDSSLREPYADLVRWRDALYGAYRT
jgi:glutathione S-transferase